MNLIPISNGRESAGAKSLSVILLSPAEEGRRRLAAALGATAVHVIKEGALPDPDGIPRLLESGCDVLIVDLNHDPDRALALVETACTLNPAMTVMVYSPLADPELVVRSMRAGAREFLTDSLSPGSISEAVARALVRREESKRGARMGFDVDGLELRSDLAELLKSAHGVEARANGNDLHSNLRALLSQTRHRKTRGKPLVFVGAKGGSGVTTIASNIAVALAKESGESVVLVDLNLQLGDAALTLGLSSEFSTMDALRNESRLDSELLSKLLVRHSSGLQVLAAPDYLVTDDESGALHRNPTAVMKVMNILRHDFAWVVLDAGWHYAAYLPGVFEAAEKIYLVAQVSITELRNANRIIATHFGGHPGSRLEVVFNRFTSRPGEIDEQSIARALMVPSVAASWRVPNDFDEVRAAQNTATPLVLQGGAVARVLLNMARSACGKNAVEVRKRRFALFS